MPYPSLVLAICFCIIRFVCTAETDAFLSDISRAGERIFEESKVFGVTVRQCSCDEQTRCIEQIRSQARSCLDPCWNRLQSVTPNPAALRQCVTNQGPMVTHFLRCINKSLHSCWPDRNGPQVPKQDFLKLVRLSEEKLESSKVIILRNPALKSIEKLITAGISFGRCVKDCMSQMNARGSCFDQAQCQPSISQNTARKTLRKCMKSIDWKKTASEFCDCAWHAGISELKSYCPVLRAMARNRGQTQ
uniref:Chondroitin proteoglycan 4 domain-containing protein n=1 Tax=Syphacia muris TaxID=451379 RepID=A0A0N5ASA2_9BILA